MLKGLLDHSSTNLKNTYLYHINNETFEELPLSPRPINYGGPAALLKDDSGKDIVIFGPTQNIEKTIMK